MLHCGRRDFMKSVGTGLAFVMPEDLWASSEEGDSSSKMPAESFIDFLEDYGKAHPPSLTYREGDDFSRLARRVSTEARRTARALARTCCAGDRNPGQG